MECGYSKLIGLSKVDSTAEIHSISLGFLEVKALDDSNSESENKRPTNTHVHC